MAAITNTGGCLYLLYLARLTSTPFGVRAVKLKTVKSNSKEWLEDVAQSALIANDGDVVLPVIVRVMECDDEIGRATECAARRIEGVVSAINTIG